jgi:hypothetical protein
MAMFEGIVSEINTAMSGLVSGNDADLALNSASASTQGEFEADLVALYNYYNQVHELYESVTQQVTKLKSGALSTDTLVDSVLNDFGFLSSITGVSKSIDATLANATSPSNSSLTTALLSVQNALSKHLTALEAVYSKYIAADDAGASTLNSAAAAGATYGTPTPAPTASTTHGTAAGPLSRKPSVS